MSEKEEELLERFLKVIERQDRQQAIWTKSIIVSAVFSGLSLMSIPIFYIQLSDIKAENRQNHSDKVAYETSTQVSNAKMVGILQGMGQMPLANFFKQYEEMKEIEFNREKEKHKKENLY